MPGNTNYKTPTDLPDVIPVFPLSGALLLPRGQMPLNIFEPRYMAMVDDALASHRIIGMIQPTDENSRARAPELYAVGCAGRITQLAETGDGDAPRYFVQLNGVARFRVREEMRAITPYRQCAVDFSPFAPDLTPRMGEDAVDRASVLKALKDFSKSQDVQIDWDNVQQAPNEPLVNALAMMSPYGAREKQALLEAADLKTRAEILVAITEMELARDGGSETSMQ
jgi:uncharacterized protein